MKWYATWAGESRDVQDHMHAVFGESYDGRIHQITVGGPPPETVVEAAIGAFRFPNIPASPADGFLLNCEPWKWSVAEPPVTAEDVVADRHRVRFVFERLLLAAGPDGLNGIWWPAPGLKMGNTDYLQCYVKPGHDPRAARSLVRRRLEPYLEAEGYDRSRLMLAFKGVAEAESLAAAIEEGHGLLGDAMRCQHWVDIRRGEDYAGVITMEQARALADGRTWSVDDLLDRLRMWGHLGGVTPSGSSSEG